jgi:hypothetical protein
MPMSNLDQWEKRLQPAYKRRLKMIGEVGLSRLEMEDIANGVRNAIKRNSFSRVTDLLDREYPFSFLSLLTFFSTYNTARDYWGALGDEIGVERNHFFNQRWHQNYLFKVKKLGLRYFDFEDVNNPYVTTIRFHGGIPVYSLRDYFRFVVLPSVDRPELNEVPSDQALETLLDTNLPVDAPVRTFLENSGDLGLEFFDASRKLARHYRQFGVILSAEEADLPDHITEEFENFIQEVLIPTERGLRIKLRKPVLLFSPYYDRGHLFVRLPEQELPLRYADGELEWNIRWSGSGNLIQQPCKVKMHRQYMVIQEPVQPLPIEACPRIVNVSLKYLSPDSSTETLHDWSIRLKDSDEAEQIIGFRSDGVLLHPGNPFPAEELLLVYPENIDLQIEGVSHPSRVYGNLFGAWKGWQANGWDLSHSWSVQMLRDGQIIGAPVPIAGELPLPELLGDSDRHDNDPGGTELFLGEIPRLRIPIRPDMPLHQELDRWRIKIYSIGPADPDCEHNSQLGNHQSDFEIIDSWAEIPLTHFLGLTPVGTYSVYLNGPIENEKEFRFRLWPKVTVHGLKAAIFPRPAGPEIQRLTLMLPDNARCDVQAGTDGVEVNQKTIGWEIVVAPDATQAGLNLIWKQPDKEDIWVPFYLCIPRLRWSLVLGQDQGDLQWSFQSFHKSLDQILQTGEGAIHVEMPGLDAANHLYLELFDVDNDKHAPQSESFHRTPFSKDWKRIGLERFADTLRHNSGLQHFDLSFQATRNDPIIHIPLVIVTRKLDLTDVNLIPIGELRWRIAWKAAYLVKNCWVLLQPAWQPWIPPQRFRIPDITAGSIEINKIGLPSSRYHLYFYVSAFEEAPTKRIPKNVEAFDVDLCNPYERLAELEIQLQNAFARNANETIFKSIFEMVCIYDDIGDIPMRDQELSKLATPFVHITDLQLLLVFFNWLDNQSIQGPYVTFFYRIMFKPELVGQFLPQYHKNDPELKSYLAYVPRLKDIYSQSALMIAGYSDDPVVLTTCFHRLLQQEEFKLIPLLIEMIENSRLTSQDVADLLAMNAEWAFNVLLEYQSSSLIDSILVALIEKKASLINPLKMELRHPLIIRILPLLVDQNLISIFIRDLLDNDESEGYDFLMRAYREKKLDISAVTTLLAINPKLSIYLLREAPPYTMHLKLLDWLKDHFPDKAGLIKPGSLLMTPFGFAGVQNIRTITGQILHLADPHQSDLQIYISIGKGKFRETAILDTSNWTLFFPNKVFAYQCSNCKFTSPNQRAIREHHDVNHHYKSLSFKKVSAKINITIKDIQII